MPPKKKLTQCEPVFLLTVCTTRFNCTEALCMTAEAFHVTGEGHNSEIITANP